MVKHRCPWPAGGHSFRQFTQLCSAVAVHQGGRPAHAHAYPAGPRLPTRGLRWLSTWLLPTLASYPKEGLPPRNECFAPLGQLPPVPGHPETRFRQVSSNLPTRTCFPPRGSFPSPSLQSTELVGLSRSAATRSLEDRLSRCLVRDPEKPTGGHRVK